MCICKGGCLLGGLQVRKRTKLFWKVQNIRNLPKCSLVDLGRQEHSSREGHSKAHHLIGGARATRCKAVISDYRS